MYESWVDVDLGVLKANLTALRTALPKGSEPMLVVKANAYGHGTGPVCKRAAESGVRWLAVVHASEAEAARRAAPRSRILMLGPPPSEMTGWLAKRKVTPVIVSLDHARALSAEAVRQNIRLPAHLKIDTGMGRLGMAWKTAGAEAAETLRLPGLKVEGICTHFARVEAGQEDPAHTQMARFFRVAEAVDAGAGRRLFRHVSSSRAFLMHPEWDLDGVRLGIVAYGYGASDPAGRVVTRPLMQWKTRVVQARAVAAQEPVGYYGTYTTPAPTRLAVVALGYADGYLRALSNRGHMIIGGRRCRVVGRVSMNWVTVDVGLYAKVQAGDEVVVIGRQGHNEIWADEMATLCRTIPYEVLTSINHGIERRYSSGGEPAGTADR